MSSNNTGAPGTGLTGTQLAQPTQTQYGDQHHIPVSAPRRPSSQSAAPPAQTASSGAGRRRQRGSTGDKPPASNSPASTGTQVVPAKDYMVPAVPFHFKADAYEPRESYKPPQTGGTWAPYGSQTTPAPELERTPNQSEFVPPTKYPTMSQYAVSWELARSLSSMNPDHGAQQQTTSYPQLINGPSADHFPQSLSGQGGNYPGSGGQSGPSHLGGPNPGNAGRGGQSQQGFVHGRPYPGNAGRGGLDPANDGRGTFGRSGFDRGGKGSPGGAPGYTPRRS